MVIESRYTKSVLILTRFWGNAIKPALKPPARYIKIIPGCMKALNTGYHFSRCFSRVTASRPVMPVNDSSFIIKKNLLSTLWSTGKNGTAFEKKIPQGFLSKLKTLKLFSGEIQTDTIHNPANQDNDIFSYPQNHLRFYRFNGTIQEIVLKTSFITFIKNWRAMKGINGVYNLFRKFVSGVESSPICDVTNQSTSYQGSVK